MSLDELKDFIESDGWNIADDVSWNDGSTGWDIRQFTPAGEDWGFIVEIGNTVEEAVQNIINYAENFDPIEEQTVYIDMRGENGIPDDIQTLLDDGKWKQEVLNDLAAKLKGLNLQETKNTKQLECPQCGEIFDKDDLVIVDEEDLDVEEDNSKQYYECPECGYRDTKRAFKSVDTKLQEADGDEDVETESENDQQLNDIIEKMKETNPLFERVISEIVEDSEDYNGDTKAERILARLSDISHGLSSGIVSSLIYYADTSKFFDEYYDDIYDMLDEWEEDGFQYIDTLKRNHSETEVIMNTDSVKNDVVWAVYEYIASNLEDEISQI